MNNEIDILLKQINSKIFSAKVFSIRKKVMNILDDLLENDLPELYKRIKSVEGKNLQA